MQNLKQNNMKKIQLSTKLMLNKSTVSKLNNTEMEDLKGGITFSLSGGARCQWSNGGTMNANVCKVEWRHSNLYSCTAR